MNISSQNQIGLHTTPSHERSKIYLIVVSGLFLLTIFFVNPVREEVSDDDFSYILTVRHLAQTGEYRLHDWAVANMPFQVYWGRIAAFILGDRLSSYIISTLILAVFGLVSFYLLCREHGLDQTQAALWTLALYGSPLFLRYSFSFMTDVPFLSLLIIALLLYTQAIRIRSFSRMFLASLIASSAILTRQIGLLIIPALLMTLLIQKSWRDQWLLLLSGILVPVPIAVWQSLNLFLPPTWGFLYSKHLQDLYVMNSGRLIINALWRLTVIPQYIVLFCVPLAIAFIIYLPRQTKLSSQKFAVGGAIALFFLSGAWIEGNWLMPHLNWSLEPIRSWPMALRIAISSVAWAGGIFLMCILLLRYFASKPGTKLSIQERLLDFTMLCFLGFHLLFWQLFDRYLIVFLPLALIVVGRFLRPCWNRFRWIITAGLAAQLLISAIWTQASIAKAEANWRAAEMVKASGVSPERIFGPWAWNSYYTFPDYLKDIGYRPLETEMTQDYFVRWFSEKRAKAQYLISDRPDTEKKDFEVVKTVPARSMILGDYTAYILKKQGGSL
jgi:hypothetical protein